MRLRLPQPIMLLLLRATADAAAPTASTVAAPAAACCTYAGPRRCRAPSRAMLPAPASAVAAPVALHRPGSCCRTPACCPHTQHGAAAPCMPHQQHPLVLIFPGWKNEGEAARMRDADQCAHEGERKRKGESDNSR
ncbi:hypothetical protein C2845_PM13G07230 [Panicum miliaceum]|uniref:Secreted protein n=1 Tax=Panicum miliaceum TaxID=4540 RepID=A0A3L6RKN3_PANMI|nr:hypothetical protein C2845_PM13G07230 [Panicum miliaceum]